MVMKSSVVLLTASLVACDAFAFHVTPPVWSWTYSRSSPQLRSSPDDNTDRMKEIMKEESMNAQNMKASAAAMKNMKPSDIEQMMAEMDSMPTAQLEQLKAMGMDPVVMKKSLEMMKKNPAMMKGMADMMEQMTPEQLMEQSRMAQEQLQKQGTAAVESAITDIEIASEKAEEEEEEEDDDEDAEPIEPDEAVLDTMFRAAELMSEPPTGGVSFYGFCTVPPVAVLAAGTGEDDLSRKELTDCWNKGSLGATRVDREGFRRVWMEVQDNYYSDIMEEARERTVARPESKTKKAATPSVATSSTPTVGSAVAAEQLSENLKNMKDEDVAGMMERMSKMTPQEEARMKAMGVDPEMMKKSAEMMNSNPLLRKAWSTMMKNTPPEQLMKSSQMAQEKLANMSDEEKRQMLEKLKQ